MIKEYLKDKNIDGYVFIAFKDGNIVDIDADGNINHLKLFNLMDFFKKDLDAKLSYVNLSEDVKNVLKSKENKKE